MKPRIIYEYTCDVCKKTEQDHRKRMPLGWSIYKITEEAYLDSYTDKVLVCTNCKPYSNNKMGNWMAWAIEKFFKPRVKNGTTNNS